MTNNPIAKLFRILDRRLREQGVWTTFLWAADHTVRRITGANILSLSRITPHVQVGGQYRRHGWPRLAARGVTAVVNLRIEFDDQEAGIAPPRYLYLPTVDDDAPTLQQLEQGALFIAQEAERGGSVFVHCGAGVGRAPTVAAAYLVRTGLEPEEAWACIREARPFIRPTPVQVEQLERFAQNHN